MTLFLCPACHRHLHEEERRCPFCQAEVAAPSTTVPKTTGITRAVWITLSAGLAAGTGCEREASSTTATPPPGLAADDAGAPDVADRPTEPEEPVREEPVREEPVRRKTQAVPMPPYGAAPLPIRKVDKTDAAAKPEPAQKPAKPKR